MAEFGVASGAAGVISLGLTVCHGLAKYYQSWKDQDDDVTRTLTFLEQRIKLLHQLENVLGSTEIRNETANQVNEYVEACRSSIERLQKRYQKITRMLPSGARQDKFRLQLQRALYPFKESTLAKLREDLTDIGRNLTLALDNLNL